jgi:hypothetical protein
MIPDWKLERYLTGDLPESEMREIRELEKKDEVFAQRVKLMREDNAAILRKMPFERLSEKLDAMPERSNSAGNTVSVNFRLVKFAAAAAFVLAVVSVALFSQREIASQDIGGQLASDGSAESAMAVAMADEDNGTRIKGLDARMEVWKKTGDSAVQMQNLDAASEGDEIQLRYSVPEKCYGLLFSMDGNGTITMHMGDNNRAIVLEPGKMTTLPFAYKLDNAPKFEKFFLLTSKAGFAVDVDNIDAVFKNKEISNVSITLRKVAK